MIDVRKHFDGSYSFIDQYERDRGCYKDGDTLAIHFAIVFSELEQALLRSCKALKGQEMPGHLVKDIVEFLDPPLVALSDVVQAEEDL
jgi:hypothetical protein